MIRHLTTTLLISLSILTAGSAFADEEYIDVSGYGEAQAWPDYVELVMTISTTNKSAANAKANVDQSMNQALTLAEKYRIAEADIDAARISRQPQWEWNKDGRQYKGEQISRNLTLTLRDLDQYGALSDELIQIENLSLSSNRLGFNDQQALQREAMKNALLDARNKATFMAATLDNQLDGVLYISEQSSGRVPMLEMRAMATAKMADPAPMMIQQQTVSASVQVRFALDD